MVQGKRFFYSPKCPDLDWSPPSLLFSCHQSRLRLKCDGTRAETRFRLSAKRTSPFKSAGASVQSTTGSRGVRISGSNAGYTIFRGSVKSTGYPLHSLVSPSLPLPCVTVCHHISTGLYCLRGKAAGGVKLTIALQLVPRWRMSGSIPLLPLYNTCSKKDRTFAIKTLLLILQHFKHCPLQSSPLYWRYTVPNVSFIVGMLPGTHFLWWRAVLVSHFHESPLCH
jgi:hypothetical protein